MRRLPAVAALVVLAACADIPPSAPPPGDASWVASPAEVWLAIGDEIRVDSLARIGFTGVPADSRCPSSVLCVWAGDGAAQLAVGIGMGPSYPYTVHTTLEPRQVNHGGYVVTLLDLSPYPQVPGQIPLDEYAIRIRVERLIR